MDLVKQLEDKKKEHEKLLNDYIFKENEFLNLRKDISKDEYCDVWGELWEIYCDKEVKEAEIAILKQAIAEIKKKDEVINFYAETLKETNEKHKVEMQKQRQEILEKIDKWRKDKFVSKYGERPNVMCDEYWEELKEQLNQPKTENDN